MNFSTLLLERDLHVAVVTVNRPDKLNALNSAVLRELYQAFEQLCAIGEVRAVVLTGAGTKSFVAGADIPEMSQMTPAEAKAFSDSGHRVGAVIESAPFPVIAAVNGFALGGGCELALSCDFIYAADNAKFGQPEVNLGLMPGFGGTQRLARRIGLGHARELVYSGDVIGAEQALALRLVNRVLPAAELLGAARGTAHKIASKAPLAVAACKRAMLRGYDADLATATELEAMAFSALFGSADQREGTAAFLAKRPATFTGK